MTKFFVLAAFVVALTRAQAQGPDDQYVRIYNSIQEAETLTRSQPSQALAKFLEAQTALQRLQKIYPDWNPKIVSFRLSYLADRIAAVSPKAPAPASAPPPAAPSTAKPTVSGSTNAASPLVVELHRPPRSAAPPDWENQITGLQNQV